VKEKNSMKNLLLKAADFAADNFFVVFFIPTVIYILGVAVYLSLR